MECAWCYHVSINLIELWKIAIFWFYVTISPPLSESTCCIYVKLFHYITLKYQNGEGSFRLSIIKTPVFLMIFFIYLISCRCTTFQKQIYDVDMMKLISLPIQIFHSFVTFTWCNQHSCWCIISNCTCLTYTLQYQTYIGTCTCK